MAWAEVLAAFRRAFPGETSEDSIRTAVDGLLLEAGVTEPPTPLALVGSFCGVVRTEVTSMRGAGRLIPLADGGYLVQVNKADSRGRQRFSTAHEICHALFDRSHRTRRSHDDQTTGTFLGSGEEHLCDVGAAHFLLHPAWVRDLATGCKPSLKRLFEIARACDASVEATARQVTALGVWDCSFVFWEPGYRKSELELLGRAPLPGFKPTTPVPIKKLRVARVYPGAELPYFPPNSSVPEETSIPDALGADETVRGIEEFVLSGRTFTAECESRDVSYRRADGEKVDRVLTLVSQPVSSQTNGAG